jgi:hypothetical protein
MPLFLLSSCDLVPFIITLKASSPSLNTSYGPGTERASVDSDDGTPILRMRNLRPRGQTDCSQSDGKDGDSLYHTVLEFSLQQKSKNQKTCVFQV